MKYVKLVLLISFCVIMLILSLVQYSLMETTHVSGFWFAGIFGLFLWGYGKLLKAFRALENSNEEEPS